LHPRSDVSDSEDRNGLPIGMDGLVEALESLGLRALLVLEVGAFHWALALDLFVVLNKLICFLKYIPKSILFIFIFNRCV
jgi:hypothetical protein